MAALMQQPSSTDAGPALRSRYEVLRSLEPLAAQLTERHLRKRKLWYPSELLPADEQQVQSSLEEQEALRGRARTLPDAVRVSLALNLLTEEGLPHFHRLIATYLGSAGGVGASHYDSVWMRWNNLWTAEEDRHGCVLRDYVRDARLFDMRAFEQLQYRYIEAGFNPDWQGDPYRLLAYTSLQERATQFAHQNTGKLAGDYEPLLQTILGQIASDEARHYAFYREMFKGLLQQDPNRALMAAAEVLPALSMPGHAIPGYREMSEVVHRSDIYGPRQYQAIVEDILEFWAIRELQGLDGDGARAQETLLRLPQRLARLADYVEKRMQPKTYTFDFLYQRPIALA